MEKNFGLKFVTSFSKKNDTFGRVNVKLKYANGCLIKYDSHKKRTLKKYV